jgi:hypothetical protein
LSSSFFSSSATTTCFCATTTFFFSTIRFISSHPKGRPFFEPHSCETMDSFRRPNKVPLEHYF